jgi:ATP/maltotriose-dependent transcriptional regulator MalT
VGRVAAKPAGDLPSWVGSSFELVESKLHPPPARAGIVPRTGLIERPLASDAVPVVCVVAPAGYGKTTLLAQWAQGKGSRVGWVPVDERDNDPAVLLTYVMVALDRVEPIDPRVVREQAGTGLDSGCGAPAGRHVFQHTVKTQAMSVYRKLGVSSRSQAVQRLQELGLGG